PVLVPDHLVEELMEPDVFPGDRHPDGRRRGREPRPLFLRQRHERTRDASGGGKRQGQQRKHDLHRFSVRLVRSATTSDPAKLTMTAMSRRGPVVRSFTNKALLPFPVETMTTD